MNSWNYVCFECRRAVRRDPMTRTSVRCPECGAECRSIGKKIRVPARHDVKAWAKLREYLRARRFGVERRPLARIVADREMEKARKMILEARLKKDTKEQLQNRLLEMQKKST